MINLLSERNFKESLPTFDNRTACIDSSIEFVELSVTETDEITNSFSSELDKDLNRFD